MNTTHLWGKGLKLACAIAASSCLIVGSAFAGSTPDPSDYVIFPTVRAGESLRLQFRFDGLQSSADGPANFLIFNLGGGFATTFLSSRTKLYANDVLLADVDSTYASAFFTGATGLYIFGDVVDPTAFASILNGDAVATLLFTPTFSDASEVGVTLSGWRPHVGTSTGPSSLTDIYPAPAVTATVIKIGVGSLTFQGVTFTTKLVGKVFDVEIDASARNGDWADAMYIDSIQLDNIGTYSTFTMGGSGAAWTLSKSDLKHSGCHGGGKKATGACAQGTPLSLTDDMHFTFTFDAGAILDDTAPYLTVRFLNAKMKNKGSMLAQPVLKPAN